MSGEQRSIDPSRWFDAIGSCAGCGKPAHGQIRGDRNQSMGNYCTKCGQARVRKADKERERHEKRA